ncbi:MAG: dihydropteroate synthase [Desulfitobacteriia bacterium]|jgi:dihydropteroate synthase
MEKLRNSKTINLKGTELEIGKNTLLMGILNCTPDSFSDGGKYFNPEKAFQQAEKLFREGADILDIGAESTRPGYRKIEAEEEWARLEPLLKQLLPGFPIPVSIDTQKAVVAEKALKLGASLINDIWGLQGDPQMAKVIGSYQAAVVIMHNSDHTVYRDLMAEIIDFLARSIEIALASGIQENQIIVDPGIGFGKTVAQNIEVIRRLGELKSLGFPVLLGASRKSLIGKTLNLPVEERLEPTIAINTLGIAAGVDILRVHDVGANKKAARMVNHILG